MKKNNKKSIHILLLFIGLLFIFLIFKTKIMNEALHDFISGFQDSIHEPK
jgi:hypothetical protein